MARPVMQTTPRKELSLFDSTCIIVRIIVGAGIYETVPTVATNMLVVSGAHPLKTGVLVGQ